MHKCSENLLWVCDLFYGFDRKMSYKDIPEAFQPLSIANNKYTFTDGVYSIERDKLFENATTEPDVTTSTHTLILVEDDDTATGEDPPSYVRGIRRVRNVCADLDFSIRHPANSNVYAQWVLDIVVIRQGQNQAFLTDILGTRSGYVRSSNQADTGLFLTFDNEELSLCYPGYVDLNSGDKVVVRLSVLASGRYFYFVNINASALVRFG